MDGQRFKALGRGQLKHFDERCAEIRRAMNYFYDQLEKLPSLKPIRVREVFRCRAGGNFYLHTHEYFRTFDPRHKGVLGRIAYTERDIREDDEHLKTSEEKQCISAP